MKCPQCGDETSDDEWNCPACRINVYWATQHYQKLSELRTQQGLPAAAATPAFLLMAHRDAMAERSSRELGPEPKVRHIARLVMKRQADRHP